MTRKQNNEIGRLNVAMFKDKKSGKPECLRNSTEDDVPVWSECRIIDGALYQLDSAHATMEAAVERQDKLRETTSAQAYRAARAKFIPMGKGLYKPAVAAVYKLPFRGARGIIVDGKPTWPATTVQHNGRVAPRPKNVIVSKSGARIIARPKTAETEEADA